MNSSMGRDKKMRIKMRNKVFLSLRMMNSYITDQRLYFTSEFIEFRDDVEETTLYLLALVKNLDIETKVKRYDGDYRYYQRKEQ
jgi:hypothetical protein